MNCILYTDEQMLTLKKELNFLLWTTDVAPIPKHVSPLVKISSETIEPSTINIQCVSHSVITAGIFFNRGFTVTTRVGSVFVTDPSPKGNPADDLLNQIIRHWWFSLDDHGLVDLSLHSETEDPLIYCNHSIGGRWRIVFSEDRQKIDDFLKARQKGCFYFTSNKQLVSHEALAQSLAQPVGPAKKRGIILPYKRMVEHCEQLLAGNANTLANMTQTEAWQQLAES